jgi:cellulose 1,4-beta-cellobiosidase
VGYSGWMGGSAGQVANVVKGIVEDAIKQNPDVKKRFRGFSTNTSNYAPLGAESGYVGALAQAFSGVDYTVKFITDTSRNGADIQRKQAGSWCNVMGAGLGIIAKADPDPKWDAYIWTKPPGQSDGVSSGSDRFDPMCGGMNTNLISFFNFDD